MNKQTHYAVIHRQLAQRYMLTTDMIATIRHLAVGEGKSLDEVIAFVTEDLEAKKAAVKKVPVVRIEEVPQLQKDFDKTILHTMKLLYLLQYLMGVVKARPDIWQDLTRKTEMDREVSYV